MNYEVCPHLNEGAVEHVWKALLPLRRQDLQAQALHIRSTVGDGTEQVAGGQAELLERLFDPDEKDVRQLCSLAQLSCRLK